MTSFQRCRGLVALERMSKEQYPFSAAVVSVVYLWVADLRVMRAFALGAGSAACL